MSPDPADQPESWPVGRSDVVTEAGPFTVRNDRVSAPSFPDEELPRLVLDHPGACVVLAVDDDRRAFVLHQYRHAARLRFVELPAGLLDADDEEPLAAAQRELREEAGLAAERWSHLLSTYPSPGVSSERIEFFLAEGLSAAEDRGDFVPEHEEADMTTAWVAVDDLLEGVLAGRLTNGPLALAVLTYTSSGGNRT